MQEAMSENPSGESVHNVITEQINSLKQHQIVLDANTWIGISRVILSAARQEQVDPGKVAKVIAPIMDQFGNIKNMIAGMPVNIAVNSLQSGFGLQLEPGEKEYLKLVIQQYKDLIKGGNES